MNPQFSTSLLAEEIIVPSAAAEQLRQRAHLAIPGGAHTYAKGDDQFSANAPAFIVRGNGSHVWDSDGREFIEFGAGLRSVTLGHSYPSVVAAATSAMLAGTNFGRPSVIEVECAEKFLGLIPTADMVKFTKDGSTAATAALKLARAVNGRPMVAFCGDHPFYSYDDWFIASTGIPSGTTAHARQSAATFRYNELETARALFAAHPDQISALFLEPARTDEPAPGFLEGLRDLCTANDTVLVFDETVTGFRWDLRGAQGLYGVRPDLSVWGKALANGFSVAALAGNRDLMERGGLRTTDERVFLLSTTHGAETHALAAATATMQVYETEPVIETLAQRGAQLRAGVTTCARNRGLERHITLSQRDCSILYGTFDHNSLPSQSFRTLFLQELVRGGIMAPSFIVNYGHTVSDIERTIEAVDRALDVYSRALEDGSTARWLVGPAVRPVYRPFNDR